MAKEEKKVKIKLYRAIALPTGKKVKRPDGYEVDEVQIFEPMLNGEQRVVEVTEEQANMFCKPIKSYVENWGETKTLHQNIFRAVRV